MAYDTIRFVEAFHTDCGTLIPSVEKRIVDVRDISVLVLMIAHQSSFFLPTAVLFRKNSKNIPRAKNWKRLAVHHG